MARNVKQEVQPASDGPVEQQAVNPHAASGPLPLVTSGKAPQMGGTPGFPQTGIETRIGQDHIVNNAVRNYNVDLVIPFKRFRVMNGGWLMHNGVRTALRAGKVIDDRNYDIARIKSQGFKLELITDDDDDNYAQNNGLTDPPLPPLPGAPR